MLELSSISKSFADALVLDNLNLTVAPGSRTAIVGPSGSGKTTLLRVLAGFETPARGPTSDGSAMFRRKGRCFLILMLRTISPGGSTPAVRRSVAAWGR